MFDELQPTKTVDKPIDPTWAWTAYEAEDQRPWDLRMAGHLFRRERLPGEHAVVGLLGLHQHVPGQVLIGFADPG